MLIISLTSLAFLWPLSALWQIGDGLSRALAILGISAAVWIGAVAFGRVHRPVLTLAVTGLFHAFVAFLLSGFLSGLGGPRIDTVTLWIVIPSLVASAGIGALAGLAALGVQRALQPRAPQRGGGEA